jgi:hypothetical protein
MWKACQPFAADGEPDFFVRCSWADYDRQAEEFKAEYRSPAPSDVYLEVNAVLRKVSEGLINYGAFLMHGAVICVSGQAYLFAAKSGTGKTTHIMKWLENLPDAFVVNGDKPFILTKDDGTPPLACGSPWAGKENLYTNAMVPLKSIILLERAEENHIEQISFAQAFPTLLQQVYRPEDEEKMRKTLRLMQRLNPAVSFWRFQCNNFKDDCFDVAYNALVKGQP